jgi:hypothetical protein
VLPNERIAQGTAALRDFDPVYVGVNTGGYWPAGAKSASPQGSDISAARWHFAFVPEPAVSRCSKLSKLTQSPHPPAARMNLEL